MKNLSFLFAALIIAKPTAASANSCPNLSGQFYCLTTIDGPEPKLDILTIKQSRETPTNDVTVYHFDWKNIPGEGTYTKANDSGILDPWGWISGCKDNRLISVTQDYSQMSELYIDGNDLVRLDNGYEGQRCSRKQ